MSSNVCRYLTFSVAIAKENVAKPLQISAVVQPEFMRACVSFFIPICFFKTFFYFLGGDYLGGDL